MTYCKNFQTTKRLRLALDHIICKTKK